MSILTGAVHPICGVYSIKDLDFHVLTHNVNIVDDNAVFDVTIDDSHTFFRLMNKATGKIWSDIEITKKSEGNSLCIDVVSMDSDIHSYKAFLIEKGSVGYIHGKFIK